MDDHRGRNNIAYPDNCTHFRMQWFYRRTTFVRIFGVYEKIRMFGFFVQEKILSSIYIIETVRILKISLKPNTRKPMNQLFAIKILIISMDVTLLGFAFSNLYIWETETKSVIYSIKLKLESVAPPQLVAFVGGAQKNSQRHDSVAFVKEKEADGPSRTISEVPDSLDISRVLVDPIHATGPAMRPENQTIRETR